MVEVTRPALDPLERLERLQRVNDAALAHLSVDDLLDELLLRVRDLLDADTAAVLLLDPDTNELVARAAKGIEEEVERGVRVPMGRGFAGRIAAERRPVMLERVDASTVVNPILFQKGIRALVGVPLMAHGEVFGVLHVGTKTQRRFSQEEMELLQHVGDRVALAIQVRLADRAQMVTEAFQRIFLPEMLPYVPGLHVASRYLPAAAAMGLGGDWYDTFVLPSGEIVLVIGDVAGRGLAAASLMGKMRNALRAHALLGGGPREIVGRLDDYHRHFGAGELVTLLVGVLSTDLSTFRFVAAGHVRPLVVGAGGAAFAAGGDPDPPLGLAQPPSFNEVTVPFEAATRLLLYTDGLVERRDESLDTGFERLRAAAEGPAAEESDPADAITTLVRTMLDGTRPSDDVAILLAQRDARPATELEFAVEARARSLATIRRAFLRWTDDLEIPHGTAIELVTAVSEASANAVEHAYGPAGGTLTIAAALDGDVVEVRVRDMGRWRGSSRGDRGHGLRLMRGLMDEVHLDATDDGTTVRMRRRVRA